MNSEDLNLDFEYKRYLKIMKPYLEQLPDKNLKDICDAWLQKLSNTDDIEKSLRNKYIFTLCYQLAKGDLTEPFLRLPSSTELIPLSDDSASESLSDIECIHVSRNSIQSIDLDNQEHTKPIKETLSFETKPLHCSEKSYESITTMGKDHHEQNYSTNVGIKRKSDVNVKSQNATLGNRAKNLVMKLRDMKKENTVLRNQLRAISTQSVNSEDENFNSLQRMNNAASASLNYQEIEDTKLELVDKINILHVKLQHMNEIKCHEIESIRAKSKLDVIKARTAVKVKIMEGYENKINELIQKHQKTIENIRCVYETNLESVKEANNISLREKDEIIKTKNEEIMNLKKYIDQLKSEYKELSSEKSSSLQKLEERLEKMEKSKNKYAKAYEAKITSLQHEKYVNECTLQLQLVKERAQIINETTEENQSDLVKTLEKLECKYRDIVGNIQATALQRRIQDQLVLENLIKIVCEAPNQDFFYGNKLLKSGHPVRIDENTNKKIHYQNLSGHIISNELQIDKNTEQSYCHDRKSVGKLLEKLHIPQKDTADNCTKK